MDVTDEVTYTLRAEAHHPPCVLESAGFCTEHSAKARGIGYEEETSPTLRAGTVPAAVALYENHSQDTRYTGPLDTAPTVNATYGMGGNNQTFVVEPETPKTLKIRSGCEGGGKGPIIQDDKSATLSCNNSEETVILFNLGKTSAPLDIHIYPKSDMASGTVRLAQGVGGQRVSFPDAVKAEDDIALLAESRECTRNGAAFKKEGFYQYSAAWDSKHKVTLEGGKTARMLFTMQEMEEGGGTF